MNIYDFDNTIYKGDSTYDFLKYSFKSHPFLFIKSCFKTIIPTINYIFDKSGIEEVKTSLFSYMNEINNKEEFVNNFCVINKKNIKQWYLDNQKETDIIISASLDIWLVPLCKMLNIKNLICTKTDNEYRILENNCKGKEKIKRLKEEFSNFKVNNAYSDSLNDIPMFEIAKKGYIVKNNDLIPYNKSIHIKKEKLFNKDFLIFVFCGGIGTLTNFIISCFTTIVFNPILSYIIGYSCSLLVTYLLNIKLIFKKKANILDFFKFVISYIPNFLILISFVYIFINMLNVLPWLVYLLAALIGIPITYILVKLFAFKKKQRVVK